MSEKMKQGRLINISKFGILMVSEKLGAIIKTDEIQIAHKNEKP